MDKSLRILKRQAINDNTAESWERYSRVLERSVGIGAGIESMDLEHLYFACVLPGDPVEPYHPDPDEGYNSSWWGLFKEEANALKFAIECLDGFVVESDPAAWIQSFNSLKNAANNAEDHYDVEDALRNWNEDPILRQGEYLGGLHHIYTPRIYIIGLDV